MTTKKQRRGYYSYTTTNVGWQYDVPKKKYIPMPDEIDEWREHFGAPSEHLARVCKPERIVSLGDQVRAHSYHATRKAYTLSYEQILELLKRDFKEHFEARVQKREISKMIGTMAEWEADQGHRCRYCG